MGTLNLELGEMLHVRQDSCTTFVQLLQRQLLRELLPGPARQGQEKGTRRSHRANVLRVQIPTCESMSGVSRCKD